jgi:hypothetical protein
MPQNLPYIETYFHLVFLEPFTPNQFPSATFRGGLGYIMKKFLCSAVGQLCKDKCLHGNRCGYGYLFETAPAEDAAMMKKYNHVPHPFLIYCPADSFKPIEELTLQITLFGRGVEYLPAFILGMNRLGRKGLGRDKIRFELTEVTIGKDPCPIYGEEQEFQISDFEINEISLDSPGQTHPDSTEKSNLTIELISPYRAKDRGRLMKAPSFRPFISSLLRRLSALYYFHAGQELEMDYRGLVHEAETVRVIQNKTRWHELERYSTRHQSRQMFGGLVGEFNIEGPLNPYLQLLNAGQVTHNGKNAVFGLGKYRIREGS